MEKQINKLVALLGDWGASINRDDPITEIIAKLKTIEISLPDLFLPGKGMHIIYYVFFKLVLQIPYNNFEATQLRNYLYKIATPRELLIGDLVLALWKKEKRDE